MDTAPSSYFDPTTGWFNIDMLNDDPGDLMLSPFEQDSRPHVFVKKLRRRPGGNQILSSRANPSRDITVQEWTAIYSAAEFADKSGMSLDTHVTLDFARLGKISPEAVRAGLSQFIRCYVAWCKDRHLPVGWIACVEMSASMSYHAHIALHVPGVPQGHKVARNGRHLRRDFRKWAHGYSTRHLGEQVPRAVRVRCGLAESRLGHWIAVTYLMKGFDKHALLCSDRNSPDGMPIRLGDLIPWNYCDPGPVALRRRITICENLGPKQRAFGVPHGFEYKLPTQPDWSNFLSPEADAMTPFEKAAIMPCKLKPVPFRSTLEDRVLDVRKLYPACFYSHVTKLDLHPRPGLSASAPATCDSPTLADQLAALPEY